ncbi:hypothetical protein Pcinc_020670 [Petrolisthes cinctipes]|uniref:Uncharacterized protein n=1 Tax=Petrolisthes cinctipes TaxID=88211 RepID=A0AAE1KL34_PETCI|nr:hypothetical protein Pcinc_020670 [Petrolisthes cinctipes]
MSGTLFEMGLLVALLFIVLITILFSALFAAQTNYLDTNINPELDALKYLGLELSMSDGLRRKFNEAIVPNLKLAPKVWIILKEKERLDNKYAAASIQPKEPTTATTSPATCVVPVSPPPVTVIPDSAVISSPSTEHVVGSGVERRTIPLAGKK